MSHIPAFSKKKGQKDSWFYADIKPIIESFIPETQKDAFDAECEGKESKVLEYIKNILSAYVKDGKFDKDNETIMAIAAFTTVWEELDDPSTFDDLHDSNSLDYTLENAILAIEWIINAHLKHLYEETEVNEHYAELDKKKKRL